MKSLTNFHPAERLRASSCERAIPAFEARTLNHHHALPFLQHDRRVVPPPSRMDGASIT